LYGSGHVLALCTGYPSAPPGADRRKCPAWCASCANARLQAFAHSIQPQLRWLGGYPCTRPARQPRAVSHTSWQGGLKALCARKAGRRAPRCRGAPRPRRNAATAAAAWACRCATTPPATRRGCSSPAQRRRRRRAPAYKQPAATLGRCARGPGPATGRLPSCQPAPVRGRRPGAPRARVSFGV